MEKDISLELEIKARKEVLKKLKQTQKRLQEQAQKRLNKRKEIIEQASQYKTIEEAQELWGYGFIDDEHYEMIKETLQKGQDYINKQISPQEAAVTILDRIMEGIAYEIKCFEFELLPSEEQAKRLRERKINEKR